MTHRADDTTPEPDPERDVLGWLPELHAEDVERAGHASDVEWLTDLERAERSNWPKIAALVALALIIVFLFAVLVAS